MVQSGKQLELTVACGLAKGDTVHVLGRIQGGSEFLAWMDDLVHAGEDDLVDWDDEKDVIKWMMEGRDGRRSGRRKRTGQVQKRRVETVKAQRGKAVMAPLPDAHQPVSAPVGKGQDGSDKEVQLERQRAAEFDPQLN